MNTVTTKFIKDMQEKTGLQYRDLEARWKQAQRVYDRVIMYNPIQYKYMKDNSVEQIRKIFDQLVLEPDKTADDIINEMFSEEVENDMAQEMEQELQMPEDLGIPMEEQPTEDLFASDETEPSGDEIDFDQDLASILGEPEEGTEPEDEIETPSESENLEDKEKSPEETGPEDAGDVNA